MNITPIQKALVEAGFIPVPINYANMESDFVDILNVIADMSDEQIYFLSQMLRNMHPHIQAKKEAARPNGKQVTPCAMELKIYNEINSTNIQDVAKKYGFTCASIYRLINHIESKKDQK